MSLDFGTLRVQGCVSEPGLNGEYEHAGTFRGGKAQWMKPRTRCYVRWIRKRWELYVSHHPSGTTYFYHTEDTDIPPACGWQPTMYESPSAKLQLSMVEGAEVRERQTPQAESKDLPTGHQVLVTKTGAKSSEKKNPEGSCCGVLYTNRTCPFAQAVHIAVEELELHVEKVNVDIFEQDDVDYLKFQELSQQAFPSSSARPRIPLFASLSARVTDERKNTLNDDAKLVLVESEIIVRYLDEMSGGKLDGSSPERRALLRMFVTKFRQEVVPCIHQLLATRDATSLFAVSQHTIKCLSSLEELFQRLRRISNVEEGPYLYGNSFSLAEILCAPHLQRLFFALPVLRP